MQNSNQRLLLKARPDGIAGPEHFEEDTQPVRMPGPGELLVESVYISIDPAMRVWVSENPGYVPPVEIGSVMRAGGVGRVLVSEDPAFQPGDYVNARLGWQTHPTVKAADSQKLDLSVGSPKDWIGPLGTTALTAYFGLFDVGAAKPGETVLVSGAAGATGSVVAQIAKMWDCKVVGIAGGPKKCAFLREELGLHGAIDYREGNVAQGLKEHCPDGIDVYFDNVGGETLGAALLAMRQRGRIVCCGAVSSYDSGKIAPSPLGIPALLIGKRLEMKGFIVLDYAARFGEAIDALAGFIQKGKIKVREDRVDGLENAPRGLMGLLAGENIGKRYVHIAEQA